ncbi:nucleolar protein dao-5-like [Haliotis rubra]|uniref:nucleolar protein dao-5-like n=1 Tax=Haliotis rubra TaxID=36100 RepID=UPI001EE5E976|nr:nucleolar protein dao-5-like [Haliotis rubra]
MSTPVRDPFEDLLDMGEDDMGVESPPPLPPSQPPKTESWMVLSKDAEDFKSMNDSDLFGSGSSSMKSSHTDDLGDIFSSTSSKSGTKAHGSTFNDLFDGAPSDKKTKKSTSSHGSTFDDLFEESKPSGSSGSAMDDLFGSVKSSTVSGTDSSLDDLFGSGSAKQSTQAASKSNGSQLVDLFGDSESGKSNSMFSSKNTDDLNELFKSDLKKSEKALDKKDDDPGEDLFGSSYGKKSIADTSRNKTDDTLDIFKESAVTTPSSKTDFDDLFGSSSQMTKSTEVAAAVSFTDDALMTNGKSSRTSSDLDDFFSTSKPAAAAAVSTDTKDTPDTVDGKAEIHVSPVTEPAKPNSSSDFGDPEPDELDFSVIEDTSLLDPNMNRSKTSLRKRSSLARRKKPTRSSMRRVFQQTEDGLSVSPTSADADKDEMEDQTKPEEEPESSAAKDEDKKPEVVKKCPVPGGKLLLGPDVLAQAQLLKGIGSKRGQPSAKVDKVDTGTKQEQLPPEKPVEKPLEKPEEKAEKAKEKVEDKPKPELKEKIEEVATSSASPEKEEPVGKKGPVGGRLVLGPDMLAQSQLLKGIGNKRGQPSSSAESVHDQTNGAPSVSDLDSTEDKQKPVIKLRKPQLSPRPKLSPPSDLKTTRSRLKEAQPGETKKGSSSISQETGKGSVFPTVLKPAVPQESTSNKTSSMTLEKVNLRSTRSSSIETKVTSPTVENNVIHGELSERKNSLRRVSPGKNKEEEKKEEKKDQPAWLTGMKLRKTSSGVSDTSSADSTPSKGLAERTPVKTSEAKASTTRVEIAVSPKASTSVRTTTPRVPREDRPQPSLKPLVDRPKPKTEAKPSSVNGRGDASVSKSPLGVRDTNTTTEDLPRGNGTWPRGGRRRKRIQALALRQSLTHKMWRLTGGLSCHRRRGGPWHHLQEMRRLAQTASSRSGPCRQNNAEQGLSNLDSLDRSDPKNLQTASLIYTSSSFLLSSS